MRALVGAFTKWVVIVLGQGMLQLGGVQAPTPDDSTRGLLLSHASRCACSLAARTLALKELALHRKRRRQAGRTSAHRLQQQQHAWTAGGRPHTAGPTAASASGMREPWQSPARLLPAPRQPCSPALQPTCSFDSRAASSGDT